MENETENKAGDGSGVSSVSGETSRVGQIRDAASKLVQSAASAVRNGVRGRHPTPCNRGIDGKPCDKCTAKSLLPKVEKVAETAGAKSGDMVDKTAIEASVNAVIQVISEGAKDAAREIAIEVLDREQAELAASRVGVSDASRKAMANLSAVVAEQYALAGKHLPAVLLGVLVVSTTARNLIGFRDLRRLVKEAKKGENAEPTHSK